MLTRLEQTFQNPVFAAYLTAGDISCEHTVNAALALCQAGVNLLEIGIPFSDPVADGPVIQQAMQQALERKVTIDDVLEVIQPIRAKTDAAIIIFSYYNPILQAGTAVYQRIKAAGADGILLVDLPLEEATEHRQLCQAVGLAAIPIISSVSSTARIQAICAQASGFIYYACRKGTTGIQQDLPKNFRAQIQLIREQTTLPIVAGFGISSKAQAAQVLTVANGFVVGSYFVNALRQGCSLEALKQLAKEIDPRI